MYSFHHSLSREYGPDIPDLAGFPRFLMSLPLEERNTLLEARYLEGSSLEARSLEGISLEVRSLGRISLEVRSLGRISLEGVAP